MRASIPSAPPRTVISFTKRGLRADRWASPKFLAGESYGTTRAAALSQYLMKNEGVYLNGIVLISSMEW